MVIIGDETEQLFVYKPEKCPTSAKKKRVERSRVEDDDDNEVVEDERTRRLKVTRFFSDSINLDDIENTSDLELADGNLIKFIAKNKQLRNAKWGFAIIDEAQYAKKLEGSYNNMLRLLKWEKLVWVTGTPLSSSLRDLLSPISSWPLL